MRFKAIGRGSSGFFLLPLAIIKGGKMPEENPYTDEEEQEDSVDPFDDRDHSEDYY